MRRKEKIIEIIMMCCSAVTVLTTIGIILILALETIKFFSGVSIVDFLTDTQWTPLFSEKHFGILPLLSGTLLTTTIATLLAVPLGLIIAVYLNEYASPKFTSFIKPILEVLAAIPTVVYGFFCPAVCYAIVTANNSWSRWLQCTFARVGNGSYDHSVYHLVK